MKTAVDAELRGRGARLTVQRRVILEALRRRDDHPTADQILADVRGLLPGLSRTTVYRVLDALVRLGLARRVSQPGAGSRFDGRTHRHHHLTCLRCGRIIDYEDPRLDRLPLPRTGLQVQDYSVQFVGVCAACRRKGGRP